jgi:hypothetical protein
MAAPRMQTTPSSEVPAAIPIDSRLDAESIRRRCRRCLRWVADGPVLAPGVLAESWICPPCLTALSHDAGPGYMGSTPPASPPTRSVADAAQITSGVARRTGPGHIASYGEGRVCSVRGCSTHLSRYNDGALCSTHREGA